MQNDKAELLDEVAKYYSKKLAQHGETPLGVDWNGEESQTLRFKQLCKIIDENNGNFSLNDLGCGYGALLPYLQSNFSKFQYFGIDISSEMIKAARRKYLNTPNIKFINAAKPDHVADYSIASGVFSVRQGRSDSEWLEYIQNTLDVMNETSLCGFSFNCLTSYSDEDKKRDYLYYADPLEIFDLCKRRYSSQVALLHDYGLYEFTIIVRKMP